MAQQLVQNGQPVGQILVHILAQRVRLADRNPCVALHRNIVAPYNQEWQKGQKRKPGGITFPVIEACCLRYGHSGHCNLLPHISFRSLSCF